MNKLKFHDLKKKKKKKKFIDCVQIYCNLQNHLNFHSDERLLLNAQLSKRKRVLC